MEEANIRLREALKMFSQKEFEKAKVLLLSTSPPSEGSLYLELPDNHVINFYLGLIEHELGNVNDAIKYLHCSIKQKRTMDAHYNLGVIYTNAGDIVSGLNEFKNALELDEKNIKILFNVGISFDRIGQFEMAISSFKEILKHVPDCIEARQRLAYMYSKVQDKDRAIKEYNKCLEMSPSTNDKAMIMNNLGSVLLDLDRYEEALKMYKEGVCFAEASDVKELIQNNLDSELGRERLLDFITPESICVEVGVFRGNYSRRIMKKNPKKLYLIDPWIISNEIGWKVNERSTHDIITTSDMELFYKRLQDEYNFSEKVSIIRTTSMEAAKQLGSLFRADFIYVDGGRRIEDLFADLFIWCSLLSEDGVLCGRDYNIKMGKKHVIYAVDTFVRVMGFELEINGNQYIIRKQLKK